MEWLFEVWEAFGGSEFRLVPLSIYASYIGQIDIRTRDLSFSPEASQLPKTIQFSPY